MLQGLLLIGMFGARSWQFFLFLNLGFVLLSAYRGHFLDGVLGCTLLLDFLLALITLVYYFGGGSAVVSDGESVGEGVQVAEALRDRIFSPEPIHVVWEGCLLGCSLGTLRRELINAVLLFRCEYVVDSRVGSLLENLFLCAKVHLARHEGQLGVLHLS